jgi:2-methylisocitrate lyase-like PEP mutase family enzyme
MVEEIRTIVVAVHVPVTADIEAGYGDAPGDVAQTVAAVLVARAGSHAREADVRRRGFAAMARHGIIW